MIDMSMAYETPIIARRRIIGDNFKKPIFCLKKKKMNVDLEDMRPEPSLEAHASTPNLEWAGQNIAQPEPGFFGS
jgi:hypothetical protein